MDSTKQVTDAETAGVIMRPPYLFIGALLLGFVLDHVVALHFPLPRSDLIHRIVAGCLILMGIAVFAASVRNFARAATPVPGNQPTRVLVTSGIHGWSRNPIYVGMFLVYCGIGTAVRSPSILLLTLPLAIIIRYGVIAREEVYLDQRFGSLYRDYKARVRRWV
jgi:protein-S-isoprenylcysteine O-methyltransferase Ste14